MALLALGVLLFAWSPLPVEAQGRIVKSRLVLAPARLDAQTLQMEGFSAGITPARPPLPEREVAVALHPHADLFSLKLRVSSGPTDTLPGRRELAPNPPFRVVHGQKVHLDWGLARRVSGGRDEEAYGTRIYPAQVVTRTHFSNRRGLQVLHLRYTPLRYRHTTRELLLDRHTEVTVSYRIARDSPAAPDAQLAEHLERVANPDEARRWYGAPRAKIFPGTGYAIFIPATLATASSKLAAFVKHKGSLGFSVRVVKDTELASINVGSKGDDADRIRLWLQQNHKALNLKYVLIIGNPDTTQKGVPMKMTYAMSTHYLYPTNTPSDYYFADLSGNWDLDKDGKVAEYPDDKGTAGVDFTPEVYVGRIPIYDDNVKALDHILAKTMSYVTETGDRSWRQRVLLPAAMLFYENQYGQTHYRIDGAEMADAIYKGRIKQFGLSSTTLYEEEGVDPSKLKGDLALTRANLISAWRKGYGLVLWFGHGSAEAVYRTVWTKDNGDKIPSYKEISSPEFFSFDDVLLLDDTRPAIVFHGSCSNGTPERPDNIGYGLLYNGAVGTISSTRAALVVLGSSATSTANIFGVEQDFSNLLMQGRSLGEALFEAKRVVNEALGMVTWFTRLEINLYGDPSLTLMTCSQDADCDDGKKCNGKEICQVGQCLAGTAVSCTPPDPCIDVSCEETTGACTKKVKRLDGETCDNGLFCTVEETCQKGRCVGQSRCIVRDNPCVLSRCDEIKKTCSINTSFAEGMVCHQGSDREGSCTAGLCEPAERSGCAVAAADRSWSGRGLLLLLILVGLALALRSRRLSP